MTETREQRSLPLAVSILLIAGGVALLTLAAFFYLRGSSRPVAVEGGAQPLAFSLGLDDPDCRHGDRQAVRDFWKNGTSVLPNGFAVGVNRLWPELDREAANPAYARVKIIPSAGLYPYYRSSTFAAEIEAFVRGGGSLICFGQPLGAMYRSLPGSPVGVGWAEMGWRVREVTGEAAVPVDHPALAGLGPRFKMDVSGFFTTVPGGQSQVLLKDAATGQPVLIAYRYGKGFVVATTSVCDVATLASDPSREEMKLMLAVLSWARSGGAELARAGLSETANVSLQLLPGTGEVADGFVEMYGPDGRLQNKTQVARPLEGSDLVTAALNPGGEPGLWRLVAYRRDSAGQPAGPSSVTWLSVGPATVEPPDPQRFYGTVTLPGAFAPNDAVIPVSVHLWNNSPVATEVTYRGPAGTNTAKLTPGKHRIIIEDVAVGQNRALNLQYEFYGPNGERLAIIRRKVNTDIPDRVFLNIDKPKAVTPGQVTNVSLQALAVGPGVLPVTGEVRLVHNGAVLWQEACEMKLNGAYSVSRQFRVPVPAGAKGRLVFEARLFYQGSELAHTWTVLTAGL